MKLENKMDWNQAQALSIEWGIKIVGALAVLVIGKWVARKITNIVAKSMEKTGTDSTLIGFAEKLVFAMLMVFVITAALSQLGVQTASVITIVGAAGLAIGLALQGALSNFAAGV